MYLSVIVPAYNEEKRLSKTLFSLDAYFKNQNYDYEIIVVDDGSTDKTVALTKDLQSQIKNLRLLENKVNHGKGYVVRQGLLNATGEYRLFTDADGSTSIDHLDTFLPELKNYDIVVASRLAKGAILEPPQPFKRRIVGNVFKAITKIIIFLPGIKDTQCGFKLFSAKSVAEILPQCRVNGWLFDIEILKVARMKGYKIKEMPAIWRNDEASHVRYSHFFFIVLDLLKIRLNLWSGIYK